MGQSYSPGPVRIVLSTCLDSGLVVEVAQLPVSSISHLLLWLQVLQTNSLSNKHMLLVGWQSLQYYMCNMLIFHLSSSGLLLYYHSRVLQGCKALVFSLHRNHYAASYAKRISLPNP